MSRRPGAIAALALALVLLTVPAAGGSSIENAPLASTPLGTAFTYQGQLKQSGQPVNGTCDFQFALFDAASGGVQIGSTQSATGIAVATGLFTLSLDFGLNAFNGDSRWLQIAAACPSGTALILLNPRQPLTAAPGALALPGFYTRPNVTSPNVIGGSDSNTVNSAVVGATIAGGGNAASVQSIGVIGNYATVSGGLGNTANGPGATVGGGQHNQSTSQNSTVGGGDTNVASNVDSTVPGGFNNVASGSTSFAAGSMAQALGNGTFVWNDNAGPGSPFTSNTNLGNGPGQFLLNSANSFHVRATGGARFVTTTTDDTGVYIAAGGTSWNSGSSRRIKDHFEATDPRAILESLVSIPVESWDLRSEDPGVRHLGPMAEDFWDAFGLGYGPGSINTGDGQGVAFAAIQGLYTLVQEKDAHLATQQEEIDALQTELASLRAEQAARQGALEARLAALEQAARN